jgi:superfamily II DNA or RNA helicase
MAMLELNTNLLVEIGGWPAMKEARALVERGKVIDAQREGAVIRARVQGAEKIYDAQITLAERVADIETRCACVESRRSGRVCAHALAAGLAILQPRQAPPTKPTASASAPQKKTGAKRWSIEEAPSEIPRVEITALLPMQLKESLTKNPVRIILEARLGSESQTRPWDALTAQLNGGFAVTEEDERLLAALENITGEAIGINTLPLARMGDFFRTLAGHPRIWLGKKHRIEVHALTDRPKITLRTRTDGALELASEPKSNLSTDSELPLPGWRFDGQQLMEIPAQPPGFSSGSRVVPRDQIPEFLLREWPGLERNFALAFEPGFDEFQLEVGKPVIEARLEGALSGLTLDLVAHYGNRAFSLDGGSRGSPGDGSLHETYFPDPQKPNRFWRRDVTAEKQTLAQAEAAGFKPVRGGGAAFSLIHENQVARFLANVLPRWRQVWTISLGPRLDATMREIDIAEPEFSLRSGSGEDWLSLDLKLSVHGEPVPLGQAEIQRWLQTGQTHARMAGKRVLLVPTESWGEMQEVLRDCAVEQEPGKIRVARTFAPFLAGALAAQGFRAGENVAAHISSPPVKDRLDPKLWEQLRPYQAQGVEWLASLARQKLHGLLADDMGLGKTVQALAFCAWLKKAEPRDGPSLVVCPTSLVINWLREAARFVPHLRTLDLTGPDRAQRLATKNEYDLLITSYAILRRDAEHYRAGEFSLVILDEAQHIKNRGSQNAQSAKALRARHRLILTGTPLENSVLDLWSLYDFLLPGYLGTATDFRERYEAPLTRDKSGAPALRVMERLRHRVRPFFLRRTKEEVLKDLPPRLEHLSLCELTGEQREVYRAVLARGRREVFEHSGKAGQGRDRIAILTTLLRLRQVCCHLDLLPRGDEQRIWKEPSAKLDRTFELIDEAIDGGHRVLLFSQFVSVLHLLRDEAQRRELRFCYLDGQTMERQAEVDRFQRGADIPLFFISLKAGGTGLNLTGADTVIHFDPWWNPAVEEQATARAHRMGQARSVQAYKLIAAGTVEEKIQALQARKRELFAASLGDDAFVNKLSGDDLEELLAE